MSYVMESVSNWACDVMAGSDLGPVWARTWTVRAKSRNTGHDKCRVGFKVFIVTSSQVHEGRPWSPPLQRFAEQLVPGTHEQFYQIVNVSLFSEKTIDVYSQRSTSMQNSRGQPGFSTAFD